MAGSAIFLLRARDLILVVDGDAESNLR